MVLSEHALDPHDIFVVGHCGLLLLELVCREFVEHEGELENPQALVEINQRALILEKMGDELID